METVEHDYHYVHKPFRSRKNILFWLYCFVFSHHVTVTEEQMKHDAHVRCTTCGKTCWLNHPETWELPWFIHVEYDAKQKGG